MTADGTASINSIHEKASIAPPQHRPELPHEFAPKAPPPIAIAEVAQAIGASEVGLHLVRAIDGWQTSVAVELKQLYRQEATQ